MMNAIFTEHARFEMERRQIAENNVSDVVEHPQQRLVSKKGRIILQNKYFDNIEKKEMLLRVIGKELADGGFRVISVYKTSKIEKYWIKGGD